MASAYPLEVVEAERFLNHNPALRGDALEEALGKKNCDPERAVAGRVSESAHSDEREARMDRAPR
jgi:hypothetical protein